MNQKSDIVYKYKKKIDLLKKHNKLYFNKDNPKFDEKKFLEACK